MEESLLTFLEGRRGTSCSGPEEIDYSSCDEVQNY